jgi:SsrA-binding protein
MKTLALNKKAFFNYEIVEQFTAGIRLTGAEIKSLRTQKPTFAGSFVTITGGKPLIRELNIPRYKYDTSEEYHAKRDRLLLMKKTEIDRIEGKLTSEGLTVVPVEIGLERQWAKVKIALVRGKKQHDKRRIIKDREEKRKVGRVMKQYR